MKKGIFLLSKSLDFNIEETNVFEYNYKDQINYINKDGNKLPAILAEISGPTHSKTMQAPSDDDPDF